MVVLNYVLGYKVILFKCTWFETNQKKKRIKHDYNLTTIQVSSTWYDNDPCILATQAQQVFYLDTIKMVTIGKWYKKLIIDTFGMYRKRILV